jgi:uncharacterized membrane protein YbhN (UPF0104 family)
VLPQKIARVLATFVETFAQGLAVMRQPGRMLVSLALSVPLWLAIAGQIWVVSLALGVVLPLAGSLLVTAMLVVGVAVPTPGAVGGFHEAYRLAATAFFGIDNDHAIGAAIVLHAVGFLPTLTAGAWMMAIEGLSVGSLGQVAGTATVRETHP